MKKAGTFSYRHLVRPYYSFAYPNKHVKRNLKIPDAFPWFYFFKFSYPLSVRVCVRACVFQVHPRILSLLSGWAIEYCFQPEILLVDGNLGDVRMVRMACKHRIILF